MARPRTFKSAYIDSNVLISVVKEEPGFEAAASVLKYAQAGRFEIMTSTVTFVEARGNRLVEPVSEKIENELRSILEHSCMIPVDLDRTCALLARRIGLTHRLKTWDAVQFASALQSEAEVFFTLDGDDFPIGEYLESVWVDRPYLPGEDDLFSWS